MSYIVPQLQLFQEFRQIPQNVVQNLNAFIFGPQYQLFRYAEAAEKVLCALGDYDNTTDTPYSYPSQPDGSIVDQDYVKLYADDVVLEYLTIDAISTSPVVVVSAEDRNKIRSAPIIGAAEYPSSQPITAETGGYFTGKIDLPEAYYLVPSEDFLIDDAEGELTYFGLEGEAGAIIVPADCIASSSTIHVVDGVTMEFVAGAGSSAAAPRTLRFADATDLHYFDVEAELLEAIDDQVFDQKMIDILPSNTAGTPSYAEGAAKVITVPYATATLDDLQAAIITELETHSVDHLYRVGEVVGTGTNVVTHAQVNGLSVAGTTVVLVPTAFKIPVYPNPYVFVTANGHNRHASLYKNVEAGDRVRYAGRVGTTDYAGESTIVGFEADMSAPEVGSVEDGADNAATQAGTNLTSGVHAAVAAASGNARDFDGSNTKAFALGTPNYNTAFTDLANGLSSDVYTVTITKTGAEGVAEATVTNASGTYRRTAVPVQSTGSYDGRIYVGNNIYVEFEKGSPEDGVFQAGDSYTVTVDYPVNAVTEVTSSGDYAGPQDTTYTVEVISGGLFNPAALVMAGLANATVNTMVADISGWEAGNVDDEFVLACTTAGNASTAVFSMTSNRGEIQTGIVFPGANTYLDVGTSGMRVKLTTNDAVTAGDHFIITVKAAKPMVRITDSAGIDQTSTVEVNDGDDLGLGLYGAVITFASNTNKGGMAYDGSNRGGLTKGDSFSVECTAEAEQAVHTIVLSDDLPEELIPGQDIDGISNAAPTLLEITLELVENSAQIPEEDHSTGVGSFNFETNDDTVIVSEAIKLQSSRWVAPGGSMPYLPIASASLFLEYRALLTGYATSVWSITDISDVETMLGTNHPDNPLAFGVNIALQNSGTKAVYFMGLPTNDTAGWRSILDRITLTNTVYALGPVTTDEEVLALVEAHVNDMSGELEKKWRIAFVGTEMPTLSNVLTASTNLHGTDWKARIIADTEGAFKKVVLTENGSLVANLKAGDQVRVLFSTDNWGNDIYTEDTVDSVLNNTTFYLVGGVAGEVGTPEKIEAYHPLNTAETATAVAAKSSGFANRRMYHVFPGNLGAYGTYVGAEYGACALAGLCSSVVPQQGLTNIEVNGFNDLPLSYGMFNSAQLNEIAAGGTLIIMQDMQGSTVYVRHQISSAYDDGNLNTSELSVTKNLDAISYYFSSTLAPFIGRYNVTPELIDVIRAHIRNGINYLSSFTNVGLLGPQLLIEGTAIRTIQQHPTLKDRIYVVIDLSLPYPLNVIELHLVV